MVAKSAQFLLQVATQMDVVADIFISQTQEQV
jgi:hypothetical protein